MVRNEYKLIFGKPEEVNKQISSAALDGWKPTLMSSTAVNEGAVAVLVYVILEHVSGT